MTTTIYIWFEGEPSSRLAEKRKITFEGPVVLPELGERVANPTAGAEGEFLSGVVKSRSFAYSPNGITVHLLLAGSK